MLRVSQYLAAAAAIAVTLSGAAHGQTLMDALAATYNSNPVLQAQRAQVRATDEDMAQARSAILPTVSATASYGRTHIEGLSIFEFGTGAPVETPIPPRYSNPTTYGFTLSQPLFDGGAFAAGRRQVRASIGREEETLRTTEQTVLLDAIAAYMDVRRAEREVEIRMNNVDVLIEQRTAASNRFELGELTRTDVAQAESRLALARSELSAAQAGLQQQRAAFERIVGFPAGTLEEPPALPAMPATLDDAINAGLSFNPQLGAAAFAAESARQAVRVQQADLMPQVTLDGAYQRREDASFAGDYTTNYSVTGNLRIPLFTGGLEQAQVRQARQLADRARDELENQRRTTIEQVTAAWSAWRSALAVVDSSRAGLEAAELAFEGVTREGEVGLRTTLDVLDAEQEALTARVNLVSAERDAYVAAHQLLSAMGLLNVEYLGVPVDQYDPQAYLRGVVNNPLGLITTSVD